MSLAIFELMDKSLEEDRKLLVNTLKTTLSYKLLFEEIHKHHSNHCTFQFILNMLNYYGIEYVMGDNIFEKVEEIFRTEKFLEQDNKYYLHRKRKITIFSMLDLMKKFKNSASNYKRYLFLSKFLSLCDQTELKWAIHILINRDKMFKLIKN